MNLSFSSTNLLLTIFNLLSVQTIVFAFMNNCIPNQIGMIIYYFYIKLCMRHIILYLHLYTHTHTFSVLLDYILQVARFCFLLLWRVPYSRGRGKEEGVRDLHQENYFSTIII